MLTLDSKPVKYAFISTILTLFGILLVYVLIVFLNISYFFSSIIADFLFGTLQFVILRNYIFNGKTTKFKTSIQMIVYLVNWFFAMLVVAYLFKEFLHFLNPVIPFEILSISLAKGTTMLIIFIWNYNIHKYITYKIK